MSQLWENNMEIKGIWMDDPKTKEPSVSLSMLVVSFVGVLVAAGLHMSDIVKDTSVMTEIFYANVALYFGRRFTAGNKSYGLESTNVDQPKEQGTLNV